MVGVCFMRVADFFCGAGGFSEGFRQAGFDICFAVDRWEPAVNTYKANKPSCVVKKDDIIRISKLSDEEFHKYVPNTEVIIGSPPCVAFSNSNKSGKADKKKGIELLESFLRIVARKRFMEGSILSYWILENVPNIMKYVKKEYTAADLGLDGDFVLHVVNETSGVYNAKYFGAPTNRKRFLCGEFPAPIPTHSDETVVKLCSVLDSLGVPQSDDETVIVDCNYPDFHMDRDEVTDHHYIYALQPFEWETARRMKEDKGYMGKMAFPEDVEKPSRTVMATMSARSRESMILATPDGGYRLPTVRETASMMSFPIDYRFYGKSKGIKHTLVGNAVPPKMSYAIAKAIAQEVGQPIPDRYIPIEHNTSIEFYNLNGVAFPYKNEIPKRKSSKFKYHIPYLVISLYRVELTNYHSDFQNESYIWDVEIRYNQGKKKAAILTPAITEEHIPSDLRVPIKKFQCDIESRLLSFEEFQNAFCMTNKSRRETNLLGPFELLSEIKHFIEINVAREEWTSPVKSGLTKRDLPKAITIGYYLLNQILLKMRGIK